MAVIWRWFVASLFKTTSHGDLMRRTIACILASTFFVLAVSAGPFVQEAVASEQSCKLVLCLGAPNPAGIAECKDVYKAFLKGKLKPSCESASSDHEIEGSITSTRETAYKACPVAYPIPSAPPPAAASSGRSAASHKISPAQSMCRTTAQFYECSGSGKDRRHCSYVYHYTARETGTLYRAFENGQLVSESWLN